MSEKSGIGNAPSHGAAIGLQGSRLTSSISENLFVAGKSFSYEDYLVFSLNEVKTIVLDSSEYTGENLVVLPLVFYATGGPILVDYYTSVISNDDGTLLTPSNRRESFLPPKSLLRLNPTNFSGDRFTGDIIPATGLGVGNISGQGNQANVLGLPFELISNVKHAITLENKNGSGVYVQIKLTWFEV